MRLSSFWSKISAKGSHTYSGLMELKPHEVVRQRVRKLGVRFLDFLIFSLILLVQLQDLLVPSTSPPASTLPQEAKETPGIKIV